jgi:predicted double-glycine peptidase
MSVIDIAETDNFHIAVLSQVHGVNTTLSTRSDMGGANFTVWCFSPQTRWKNKKTANGS